MTDKEHDNEHDKGHIKGPIKRERRRFPHLDEISDESQLAEVPPSILVNDVGRMIHSAIHEQEQLRGIKSGYRRIIFHLAHESGISQYELAQKTNLTPPTVSVTLGNMEREGLIRRGREEGDKRVTRVWLTEEGEALDEEIRACVETVDEALMNALTDKERMELGRLMLKMKCVLEERSLA